MTRLRTVFPALGPVAEPASLEELFGLSGPTRALTLGEVERLVRGFARQAVLRRHDPDRGEALTVEAERIERVLLGLRPDYVTTAWWSPAGVGTAAATALGWGDETEHAVAGLLLRLTLAVYACAGQEDWRAGIDAALRETLDVLSGGAVSALEHIDAG